MIKKYKFINFQSYLNECEVDFSVNKRAPHSYYDYELLDGSKIAKVMAVMGANGAGKSNLLKPLSFLSWFIPDSFGFADQREGILILPHAKTSKNNTVIELSFVLPRTKEHNDEVEYKYYIELNSEYIVEESLKLKTSRLYSNVISRKLIDNKKFKYKISKSKKYGSSLDERILEKAPRNCSIFSFIDNLLSEEEKDDVENSVLLLPIYYFRTNRSNIQAIGKKNISDNLDQSIEFYKNNPDDFKKIKDLLIKYDLGIEDITLEERLLMNPETGQEENATIPMFTHECEKGSFKIPIFMESSGTKSAFCILAFIMETLTTGGVAILDEFDNDLHPHLTVEIINLFKSQSKNHRNAQLLFNTHSPEVLKSLRMQHCYLVEKSNGISSAYRADDVEGLLARDNLYAKYVSGSLGAVPNFD
ncbi:AAA family ATPase [Aeromonas veronii]|uniref:AAA family ATPase n=1 Tax=Aeromonas veronii TaxID=654 RepID=UPI003F7A6F63